MTLLGNSIVCKNSVTGATISNTEIPVSQTVRSSDNSSAANTASEPVFDGQWNFQNSSDGSTVLRRHEAAGVSFNGKLYVLGGRGARGVSIYDPVTKKWSLKSAPPIQLNHFQPVV